LIVAVFYGIIPIAGALFSRYKWRRFRSRFNKLRRCTLLDYRLYRQLPDCGNANTLFRFTGEIESITDGRTLWVRGKDMTIPVSLEKTKCFLLPIQDGEAPEAPEPIRWNTVCTLTEGAKVFIGGQVKMQNNRLNFCSAKEEPLMVIFYNCPDDNLPVAIISGARKHTEYWNSLTPISLIFGALALIYIAASLLGRPAFHITVISAIVAIFIPILPVFPPGFLLTFLYRRLSWNARKLRANWDLTRFGLLPNPSQQTTSRFAFHTYVIEAFAWLTLFLGILINVGFIYLLLILFRVISF
jgi:hypothetical protein